MELKEMICALSEARGPSGSEQNAQKLAGELLAPFVDELRTDVMGNLLALRRGKREDAPTVMLDAHMDEIGLIVTGIEKGLLRFASLGGVDARMLPALEVVVLSDPPLRGVIDVVPAEFSDDDGDKPFDAEKLRIDLGLDEETVKQRVLPGTPVVFSTKCTRMGEHRLCGKSLDDRSCAAILIRALQLLEGKALDCHVAVCFSVQEELGCRGAVTAAYSLSPESAIAVDVTFGQSADCPKEKSFPLGEGPTIGAGPNMARTVTEKLISLAQENEIPYHIEVMAGHTGTNAWPIQISREGVATGVVSLPLRYMHTPVELLDLRDAEYTAKLIAVWVEAYGKEARENA